MALFTTTPPDPGHYMRFQDRLTVSLGGMLLGLSDILARHRAERALESLPYDTLKDIGFPAARGRLEE